MIWLLVASLLAAPQHRRGQPQDKPAPVENLTDDELRSRISAYLGTIDTPISLERWRSLGPKAAAVLEPLVLDKSALPTRRAHALEGLSGAAPDRALAVAPQLLHDEEAPTVVRVAALHAAGRLLPAAQLGAQLKPVLEGARDPGLRGLAADVLAQHGGCASVKAQAARESADAREAYHRALSRCEE